MPGSGIPEDIKRYIFEHIESVEQLEVLFILRDRRTWWTPQALSVEMRSSADSIANRLVLLRTLGLIKEQDGSFHYDPSSPELDDLIHRLEELYRLRKYKVMELIFSPLKRARNFAQAFVVSDPEHKKKEDSDG